MTSLPLILIISMTAAVWVLLLVAAGIGLAVALYLAQQARKVQGAEEVEKRYASVAGDLSVVKKSLNALDELVGVKLNRIATTEKRGRKKQQEEEEIEEPKTKLPSDLEFPSLVKSG